MNTAHTFQHKYTGVQIFVYQKQTKELAEVEFQSIVVNYKDWVYIGIKSVNHLMPA